MKGMFKRALAGVAAAALAVTGLALGAGAANAAPADPAITIHNAQPGHTYTAYKFAEFANPSTVGSTSYVDVNTVKDPDWTDALTTAFGSVDGFTLDSEYKINPAAAVALLKGDQLREFATGLIPVGSAADSDTFSGETAGDLRLDVTEGWYVITDSWTAEDGAKTGAKAIVATTVAGATSLVLKKDDGQLNIDNLGEVNAKNVDEIPDPGDKEVSEINGVDAGEAGTVNIGDVVTYTVTDQIPEIAAASKPYSFKFIDTASKGLAINEDSIAIEISDTENGFTGNPTLDESAYESVVDGNAASSTTTTVTVADVSDYAGKWIRLTYKATVTDDAENGNVKNTAKVDHNGVTDSKGDDVTLYYGAFNFQKVNKDGTGLANVVFNVYKGTNTESEPLKFSADGEATAGAYVYDTAGDAAVKTDAEGDLAVRGLAEGTYTVKEISNPDPAYAKNFYAEFTVTVASNGTTTIKVDNITVYDSDTDGTVEVLNVHNATELPLTGAAGTMLFTVLGLLIAGAGALVYMKSRSVKHALRG